MGIQINGNTNNINAGIGSLSIEDIRELDITGIATASNFKTGTSNVHSTGYECTNVNASGIITAAQFKGDGSNLTGISAGAISAIASDGADRVLTSDGDGTATAHSFVTIENNRLSVNRGSGSGAFPLIVRRTDASGIIAEFANSSGYGLNIGQNSATGEAYLRTGTGQPLVFATNSGSGIANERLRISSEGYVTQPNRPAFSTNAQTTGFSSNSVNYLTPSARINNGNCYNASNGRFTAPTDGTYFFYFSYVGDNGVAAPVMYFYVNDSASGPGQSCYYTAYMGTYHGQIYTLGQGDYVHAAARDWNGATPDPWNTYWGGWLLY
mgnify:CR=1 FL=1